MNTLNSDTDSLCSTNSETMSEEQQVASNDSQRVIALPSDTISESSSNEENEKYVFGISPMFNDCEQSITEDTVFKVEFKIHNINRKHNLFQQEILRRCRENKLKGYICFRNNQTEAMGIMEGSIKNINRVKHWVRQASDLIEEPLKTNVFFTWFLIANKPFELEFDVHQTPPDYMDSGTSKSTSSFRAFRTV